MSTPSATKPCPECGHTLPRQAVQCPKCEWRDRGSANDASAYQQCSYRFGEDRCPLPGGVATHTGKGGPWFCRFHPEAEHTKADRQVLDEILADPARYLPQSGHLDRLVDAVRQEHPEWQRQPGEARSAYGARMKAEADRLRSQVTLGADHSRRRRRRGELTAEERAVAEADAMERAKARATEALSARSVDLVIEDLTEAVESRAARYEQDGMPAAMATRAALEDELRARVGGGA